MDKLQLLQSRHSVRSFLFDPISKEIVNKLRAEVTMTNTHEQGMRFQIFTDDPDPMNGFSKSYGAFINPRNYMAAVVDTATPHAMERAGYFAEKFVIRAVELGLGTCFVGGTYSQQGVKAQMRAGEKLLFIILFGYPSDKTRFLAKMMVKMVHAKKMTPEQFFEPVSQLPFAIERFPMLKAGLEAVACAPSSLNKRPVRLFLNEESGKVELCAKVDESNPKNLIDLGIAKFNFSYATSTECEWGNGASLIIDDNVL